MSPRAWARSSHPQGALDAVGLAILATVAATTTAHQAAGTPLPQALTAGYTHAFQIAAIIIALAVPIALSVLRLRPTNEPNEETRAVARA